MNFVCEKFTGQFCYLSGVVVRIKLIFLLLLLLLVGIFNEAIAKTILMGSFTAKITPEMNDTWYKTRGESVRTSLKRFLLVYLGEPLNRLLRYVQLELTSEAQ